MKIAIMQPYFFPYIGYFQLISSVDTFVIYDNIQYSKGGWINRNRYLFNNQDKYISIPLLNDSDYLNIIERSISFSFNKKKIINQLYNAYCKAPFFDDVFPIIKDCILHEELNLFKYIMYSIQKIVDYLCIKTKIIISSSITMDHSLKSQEKVIAICKSQDADTYINAIGGLELYSKDVFLDAGIQLNFLKTLPILYKQYNNEFVPSLSIIDVLMFNTRDKINEFLTQYELV